MQRPHKQAVQHDIANAGHGDKVHGPLAVAHTAEDGADDVIRRDKGNA